MKDDQGRWGGLLHPSTLYERCRPLTTISGGRIEPTEGTGKVGKTGRDFGKGWSGKDNDGEVLCGSGASGAYVWVRDMGTDPPVG